MHAARVPDGMMLLRQTGIIRIPGFVSRRGEQEDYGFCEMG